MMIKKIFVVFILMISFSLYADFWSEFDSIVADMNDHIANLELVNQQDTATIEEMQLQREQTDVIIQDIKEDNAEKNAEIAELKQEIEVEKDRFSSALKWAIIFGSLFVFFSLLKLAIRIMKLIPQTAAVIKLIPDWLLRWID